MAVGSPLVRRRRLGAELRKLREAAGLTGEQAIERVGWSAASKLSRIENGRNRPDLADVMDLLDAYDVTGAHRETLIAVARDAANTRGWWRAFGDMGQRQRGYAEIESGASDIRQFHQFLVPGLVQTAEYARVRAESGRVLYGGLAPDAEASGRQARQAVLTQDSPPRYEAILDESALRRATAPPDIMRAQVRHLVEVSARPNITLRVIPFSAAIGDFYVPHSDFSLYRFTDPDDPETVVLETLTSDLHLTDAEDVSRYRLVFDWLSAAALSPEESVDLLSTLAEKT